MPFLVKSEPATYPWSQLVADGRTRWDGVRNFEARNHLRAMKKGDLCLFYHSNQGKEVVGVARVVREGYPDPTAPEGDWTAVDLAPEFPLTVPVTLATLKSTAALSAMPILTRPRISVVPVTARQMTVILKLGKTGTR